MKCKVCNTLVAPLFKATILSKYDVQYFECPSCGFVQTEEPYWLEEAYSSPIHSTDIGLVGRNVQCSRLTRKLITLLFPKAKSFIDFGGGNGMFVRLMRDYGYDFSWCDKYTCNQFSKGFEHRPNARYDFMTAFEVFEHLNAPTDEIAAMVQLSENILFSTEIIRTPPPKFEEWYYYGPQSGQHIALWSERALRFIARRFDLQYFRLGEGMHLFSKTSVNSIRLMFARSRLSAIIQPFACRVSLQPLDHKAALAKCVNDEPPTETTP